MLYTLYKNIVFVVPLFYFGMYSGFSGQGYYDPILTQLYNLVFTSIPVSIYACYDFEHEKFDLISKPELYKIG